MSSSPGGGYGSPASFCGGTTLHQMHHQMEAGSPAGGSLNGPGGHLGGHLGGGPPSASWPPAPTHNVFPSMSVNVSMNMTMHGYPPPNRNVNMDNLGLQHQVGVGVAVQAKMEHLISRIGKFAVGGVVAHAKSRRVTSSTISKLEGYDPSI